MEFEFLRFETYVMEVVGVELPLADGALSVGFPPESYAFFAELVAAYRQNSDREGRLADDARLGLFGA